MTRYRQAIAALAFAGVFLAMYLTLYKLGYVGSIACGTGGCETVQSSKWATFAGFPVALWGVGYYLSVVVVAAVGVVLAPDRAWPSRVLLALNGWGVIFSSWLTWLELVEIKAICRYCVVSAVVVIVLFALSVADARIARPGPTASDQ